MPRKSIPMDYTEEETARRLEAIMRGAFSGSPQPMKDIPKKRAKPNLGRVETKTTKAKGNKSK